MTYYVTVNGSSIQEIFLIAEMGYTEGDALYQEVKDIRYCCTMLIMFTRWNTVKNSLEAVMSKWDTLVKLMHFVATGSTGLVKQVAQRLYMWLRGDY